MITVELVPGIPYVTDGVTVSMSRADARELRQWLRNVEQKAAITFLVPQMTHEATKLLVGLSRSLDKRA
jgi:hypothetical protein